MFYNAKKQTLKTGGTTMDVISFGYGKKLLVFIPGLSLQNVKSHPWVRAVMYRKLAKKYRVYVFERRKVIPQGFTIRDMASDVAKGMKMMGISRANVMGISQGGMIAQYLAIEYPNLVNKLVLGVTISRQNEVMRKVVNTWVQLAQRHAYEAIMMDMMEKVYSDKFMKQYGRFYPFATKVGKHKDFDRFINMARACFSCNAYPNLEKISCPVLVIGGKKDKILTGKASEEIAEKLKCEIYMYENLGHSAYEEARDFQKRVIRFFEREGVFHENTGK